VQKCCSVGGGALSGGAMSDGRTCEVASSESNNAAREIFAKNLEVLQEE
jgi:hypothetical protein